MNTTTYDPTSERASSARHGFRSNDWKRDVRRAVNMAALLERGCDLPSAEIVHLPKRDRGSRTPPVGGSATVLLFTGVTRVRA